MKNYEFLSDADLLTLYRKVNEYIKTLEESKKETLEMDTETEDDK